MLRRGSNQEKSCELIRSNTDYQFSGLNVKQCKFSFFKKINLSNFSRFSLICSATGCIQPADHHCAHGVNETHKGGFLAPWCPPSRRIGALCLSFMECSLPKVVTQSDEFLAHEATSAWKRGGPSHGLEQWVRVRLYGWVRARLNPPHLLTCASFRFAPQDWPSRYVWLVVRAWIRVVLGTRQ